MHDFFHDVLIQDILFFLKGMVVGFAVSIPVGPASVMCIRRTLHRGFFMGIFSGLGVALADTFYGSLAGLGLTSIAEFMMVWLAKLRIFAGGLLIALGAFIFRKPPNPSRSSENSDTFVGAALSTFGVTLANPFILVLFAAIFAAVGLENFTRSFHLIGFLILGIFSGSMLWWLALVGSMTLLHRKVRFSSLGWTNKFAGLVIIIFGIVALVSLE